MVLSRPCSSPVPVTTPAVKTDFPRPEILVNCLADGVSVVLTIADDTFHGVMYVKGHSNDVNCRRSIDPGDALRPIEFNVKFDTCGLYHDRVCLTDIFEVDFLTSRWPRKWSSSQTPY